MYIDEVREMCLQLPLVTERMPYGPDCLAFEIGGKQFCLLDLTGKWQFFNIKVDPIFSIQLRERYDSVRPGFHMNKKHWISVDFVGDVPESFQRELIEHAFCQTFKGLPKKLQSSLMDLEPAICDLMGR